MLKRYIFFFCYIFFFTAVPFGAYYLWPVENYDQQEMMGEDSVFANPPQSGIQDNGLTNDQMTDLNALSHSMNDMLENLQRSVHASWALFACFIASILFALILAIVKFGMPELKFGGLITGIMIFNFLYFPVFWIAAISGLGSFGASIFYVVAMYAYSGPGLLVLSILAIVFIMTALFTVLGVTRRRSQEKEKLKLEMQQNLQSSQHPQF
jgi:hypothetical protein